MKIKVPTPHNEAKIGEIAKTVIMPGDPLRAKYISEKYLTNIVCYNKVRGMYGFTGEYKGKRISVQGSGMGIPSMAIYSKELFDGYDVDNIIRIGTAGSLANNNASSIAGEVELRDIVVAKDVITDSNYLNVINYDKTINKASDRLLEKVSQVIKSRNVDAKFGTIYTSDVFYKTKEQLIEESSLDIIGTEMETLALYANANCSNKNALAIFTVSDNPILEIGISSEERLKSVDEMIEIALETAIQC